MNSNLSCYGQFDCPVSKPTHKIMVPRILKLSPGQYPQEVIYGTSPPQINLNPMESRPLFSDLNGLDPLYDNLLAPQLEMDELIFKI